MHSRRIRVELKRRNNIKNILLVLIIGCLSLSTAQAEKVSWSNYDTENTSWSSFEDNIEDWLTKEDPKVE